MHIGFYNYHKTHNNNNMLSKTGAGIGDNLHYPFVLLAQRLNALGHTTATIDTDDIGNFDAIIFIDFPGKQNPYFKKCLAAKKDLYLIILESPIIKPDNGILENHRYFTKIFTWDDTVIDNKKYIKIQYTHNIPAQFDFNPAKKEKLCTLIASNKSGNHPQELYSERAKAIRWFEKNHPQDFDLYGQGWDRYRFNGTFLGFKLARLNRLVWLTKLLGPHYPSYKGVVSSKNQTYQHYQFAICYENVKDVTGYITEKIMDCFLAGCVPVYLGAPNITSHIPPETFIDKRNFDTYEKLYDYLKHMPQQQYQNYLDAIKSFLQSEKVRPFSAECFADTIIKEIL